jgi:hypothetical protein
MLWGEEREREREWVLLPNERKRYYVQYDVRFDAFLF